MKGDLIERALQDVSDGKPVDWDLLVDPSLGEDEREQLKWLRVLDEIADLYKSIHGSTDADNRVTSSRARLAGAPDIPEATWGRYRLLEKVGEGGFGSVHRAWDPQLECEVAIKILHQRDADHRLTQRLLDEGRALAKIRHPNVVRVLGVESNEGRVGLCMDFVRGQTLGDLVRTQGSLSADEAALVGRDVCCRACGRASRRLRAPRRQGGQRHARAGRAHRPDGLRCRSRVRARTTAHNRAT